MKKINNVKLSISPIEKCITEQLENYFREIEDYSNIINFYDLFLSQLEEPLLKLVMEKFKGNQTLIAKALGLSRNTLRKKLLKYEIK